MKVPSFKRLGVRCVQHMMREEHSPVCQRPLMKVPVPASFKCPLSACSGVTSAVRWLAGCRRHRWAAPESEKKRSTVKVKGGLRTVQKPGAGSPYTYRTHRERGPGSCFKAAAVQQTEPWPTSRSKGSRGSSKKLSKAKRCGNVFCLVLLRSSSFCCYCFNPV